MSFGERGGVIEACPGQVTGSPSANVFIDPNGDACFLLLSCLIHLLIITAPPRFIIANPREEERKKERKKETKSEMR
jgi:hypothetical protein